MNLQLVNTNAVIAARHFNPSVVSQIWLVDNDIVAKGDFQPNLVFSDMLVHFSTTQFDCLVVPDRLLLTPIVREDAKQRVVTESLGRIVELLPHTPFVAAGMNFTWHLFPDGENVPSLSRRIFVSDGALYRAFNSDDAQFGAYMSRDLLGGRMKLDIKPITLHGESDSKAEALQFAFNFHLDVGPQRTAVESIRTFLNKWNEAVVDAEQILALLQDHNHDN